MPANRWNIAQFFEIRWWNQYLGKQNPPSYLHWKRYYWEGFLKKLALEVPDQSTTTLLDAGCGPAGIFLNFQKASVTAIDPLLAQYQTLDHFNTDWYKNVTFHPEKLEAFSSSTTFYYVFCLNAINHVANLSTALDNLYTLTHDNGTCIISTDCHKYRWARSILKNIPIDILHPHQYDVREYQQLFEKAGFRVERKVLVKRGKVFDYYAYVLRK